MDLRIVATYTTIPSRYESLYKSMLSLTKLNRKLDAIYLGIPIKSRRLNKEYPPLPQKILDLCTVVDVPVDYGPATKIYAGIVMEKDPNTLILSCDDDVIFPPHFLNNILKHCIKFPDSVICGTGALIGKGIFWLSLHSTLQFCHMWSGLIGPTVDSVNGRNIDLVFGVSGVMYRRGFFPYNAQLHEDLFKYALLDDDIFHNDDVLISGYLSKCDIKRKVFYDISEIWHTEAPDALSGIGPITMMTRLGRAVEKMKQYGFFTSFEEVNTDDTAVYKGLVTLLAIIGIIILAVFLYKFLVSDLMWK